MENTNLNSVSVQEGQSRNAGSARRALVNVILSNGFVARLSSEDLENRDAWED